MSGIDLSGLTEKELTHLAEAINRKRGRKVDFDNMTDAERASYNRDKNNVTPAVPYAEFPKTIYGKNAEGEVMAATVRNKSEEDTLKLKFDYDWRPNPLAHGIVTHPEAGSSAAPRMFRLFDPAAEAQKAMGGPTPAEFGQKATEAIHRGGWPKGKPRKQAQAA